MEEEVSYYHSSPTETPYRTPSSSRSRRSRPYDMSPSSSPPPLPSNERKTKKRSNDSLKSTVDENISPLDPRIITPTLHASLVGEILSLRRDLENKTRDINQLETSLHESQLQNEQLNTSLASSNKETRNLKRQIQLLENDTVTALQEIGRERDAALNGRSDTQRKLEQSQKRARSHEENAEKTMALWNQAKENWAVEKRGLETKVNIVEARLKVVVNEVSKSQVDSASVPVALQFRQARGSSSHSPSRRSASALSQSRRFSGASNTSDHFGGRLSVAGVTDIPSASLADELALEEEDEDEFEVFEEGRFSLDALPEERERSFSHQSNKTHKVLGLEEVDATDSTQKSLAGSNQSIEHTPYSHRAQFVHVGVQHSPPPSPKIEPAFTISPITSTTILPVEPLEVNLRRPDSVHIPAEPASPVSLADESEFAKDRWNLSRPETLPVMVSMSCQTVEMLPSPPVTPEMPGTFFTSIDEQLPEDTVQKSEMNDASTQTELTETPYAEAALEHVRSFPIPTIAIIPPGSRPATPDNIVVLPPQTKNAGCQVDFPSHPPYNSSSMQTEEIRIDQRSLDIPIFPSTSIFGQYKPPAPSKVISPNSSRRRLYLANTTPTAREDSQQNGILPKSSYQYKNDSGPLARDFASTISRPVRSSSLFAGFDEITDDDLREPEHELFDEDDMFSRPPAKFTLKLGKLISQDSPADTGEIAAANAGEAAALENLRMSEDNLPPDMRIGLPTRTSPRKKVAKSQYQPALFTPQRRVPSPKRASVRRSAMTSNGAAAHSAQSSSQTQNGGHKAAIPPFPVPIRFSSMKPGKSQSEGSRNSTSSRGDSPTKREKDRSRKPVLRKVRSGPAVSPGPSAHRQRSRSPMLNSRLSIVPDVPGFQMPATSAASSHPPSRDASAPRPSVATGPSRSVTHTKTSSDAASVQQTSVVDAITQTMIGEWMLKYVRKRKSFGITDNKTNDWDPNKPFNELSANVTSTGIRHKRWVWLAPYERSVMWSSKQPSSGAALLGKSGRKLIIQSVLDVRDDNPMPKNSMPDNGRQFNRSIVILTPERALKFTATTQERHYIWLTALSFLSHSPLSVGDIGSLPPPPSSEGNRSLPPPSIPGSLRTRRIRDSIRIAKGSGREGLRSFTTDGSLPVAFPEAIDRGRPEGQVHHTPTSDAALAPVIPRFSAHTRNRSNTAPKPPPNSFRAFLMKDKDSLPGSVPTSGIPSSYTQSVVTTATGTGTGAGSERGGRDSPSLGVKSVGSKSSSRRGSEASAMSRPPVPPILNMGWESGNHMNSTMRMDAFMETPQRGKGIGSYRTRTGRRKDLGYWGVEEEKFTQDRSQSPLDTMRMNWEVEQMLLPSRPGDIFGSTRLNPKIDMGGDRDPFKGF